MLLSTNTCAYACTKLCIGTKGVEEGGQRRHVLLLIDIFSLALTAYSDTDSIRKLTYTYLIISLSSPCPSTRYALCWRCLILTNASTSPIAEWIEWRTWKQGVAGSILRRVTYFHFEFLLNSRCWRYGET